MSSHHVELFFLGTIISFFWSHFIFLWLVNTQCIHNYFHLMVSKSTSPNYTKIFSNETPLSSRTDTGSWICIAQGMFLVTWRIGKISMPCCSAWYQLILCSHCYHRYDIIACNLAAPCHLVGRALQLLHVSLEIHLPIACGPCILIYLTRHVNAKFWWLFMVPSMGHLNFCLMF